MKQPDFTDAIRQRIFLTGNLYENHNDNECAHFSGTEACDTFAYISGMCKNLRLERIVSFGNASPEGFWYNQTEHEWVVLLTGEAVLEFVNTTLPLAPGDWVFIPAHLRHRVVRTASHSPTRWLAIFFRTPTRNDNGTTTSH